MNKQQIESKINFINDYIKSSNAAEGSTFDANANVETKNIATMESEMMKKEFIQINRELLRREIEALYGEEISEEYLKQLRDHIIYTHDETSLKPYCVSISMYPFLLDGVTKLGGESKAPEHLASFCGSFINLVFATSAQFAGAVATVEWLMYFDHFARKDFGDNYLETHTREIKESLQHVVYSLNQPAAARGYQCVREDITQLLTPQGFKYLSELNEGDECYVWENKKIKIQKIQKLNVYNYDDKMLQFKGRNYQQTVTPNHRIVYKKFDGSGNYNIKEAKDMFGHTKLSMPIGSNGIEREDYPISDDMLQLCVIALTNGSIDELVDNDNFSGRLTIYKSVNTWGYKEIPKLLENNGIGFTEKPIKSNEFGDMVSFRIPTQDSQIILRQIKHTKKELPYFFTLLSERQAKIVINTWAHLDGSFRKEDSNSNKMLQCDNDDIRDSLQHIAVIAGIGSEIFDRPMKKFNSDETHNVKYLKLFERSDKRVSEYNEIDYKGVVWCPTTNAGVVIFREDNGVPYISGNSVFWNISIYDKPYFEAMFGNFVFPNMDKPGYESVDKLQRFFMKWFNNERTHAVLTYPVVTAACLTDGKTMVDKAFEDHISEELSEGNSFFIFMSENAHALSSCCFEGEEIITVFNTITKADEVMSIKTFVDMFNKNRHETNLDTKYQILSLNPESLKEEMVNITGTLKKENTYKRLVEINCNNQTMKVTPDHIFLVKNVETASTEEITASVLVNNSEKYSLPVSENKMKFEKIDSVKLIESTEDVVDIQLERNHYFKANNVYTHNCRLKNDVSDQMNDFSYSLGAGGVSTGSINVITINLNRLIQDAVKNGQDVFEAVKEQTQKIHKYQIGFRQLVERYFKDGLLPVFNAGFISLNKQFLTIGINGLVEAAEFLGMKINVNNEYMNFASKLLKTIADENKIMAKKTGYKFNTEIVPAENLGIKNAKWDKKDGYEVPRDCYNSYMYIVEDESISATEKLVLHGKEFMQHLDGGSAFHCNLEETPSKETFKKLLNAAAVEGCEYWCVNIKITICNDCNHIDKRTLYSCPNCGTENVDHGTRIIGYLKRVSAFSEARQKEECLRFYNKRVAIVG